MSGRSIRLLLIVLAVLSVFWMVLRLQPKKFSAGSEGWTGTVSRIEIHRADLRFVLERSTGPVPGLWMVREPVEARADEGAIRVFLTSMGSLEWGDILSSRADAAATYDLSEPQGIRVTLFGNPGTPPLKDWVFGKMSPDFTRIYWKEYRGHDVRMVSGIQRDELDRSLLLWRDRSLLSFRPDEVRRVTVRRYETPFSLVRSSESWSLNGRLVPSEKMENFLQTLAAWQADGIVDPPESADKAKWGFTYPEWTIHLSTGDGAPEQQIRMMRRQNRSQGADDHPEVRYLVEIDGRPELFWLDEHRVKDLPLDSRDFLPVPERPVRTSSAPTS
ncbi:MAG TPA: DUF4340 domain-containing protein [Elusimicrobiota bacterium]|nr:DUF4340 domain-containing protein [Elusimicrobiota bacterium]